MTTKPKLIISNPLIQEFIDRGIISSDCTEFILHAKVGHPIFLTEGKYVRDSILEVAHHVHVTDNEDEAIAGAPEGYRRRRPA